jgi:hypothetical protein
VSDESRRGEQARLRLADQVSFVVYGTIAVLAAVGGLALEAETLHARQAAAVLIVVAFAAWLSHTMWRVVRARGRRDPEPGRSHEVHELLRSSAILATGLPGAAVMMATAIGSWSVATGLGIAQGLGIAVLFAAGLVTAHLAGATRVRRLAIVITLPAVGLLIVALEVAAHKI